MRNSSTMIFLIIIVVILAGIFFLRQSGILSFNTKPSTGTTNQSPQDALQDYYNKLESQDTPNVQDALQTIQDTKNQ